MREVARMILRTDEWNNYTAARATMLLPGQPLPQSILVSLFLMHIRRLRHG